MLLYIPTIGESFKLKAPWYFDLYSESRNEKMMDRHPNVSATLQVQLTSLEKIFLNNYNITTTKTCQIYDPHIRAYKTISFNEIIENNLQLARTNLQANKPYAAFTYYSQAICNLLDTKKSLFEKELSIKGLLRALKSSYFYRDEGFVRVILPIDTVLKVDRIYIRKNLKEYDSISFYVTECPNMQELCPPVKKRGFATGMTRFWAKLDDVNGMDVEKV